MVEFEDPKITEGTPVELIPRWYEKRPRRRRKAKARSAYYEIDLKTGKAINIKALKFADGYG